MENGDNIMKKIVSASSYMISKIHAPYNHKRISEVDCLQILRLVKPGDVLLTHTRGELSNIFLDHWGHGAIIGKHGLYEAVTAGVKKTDLMFFLARKDHVMVLRPSFPIDEDKLQAYCERAIGTLYDYNFETGAKKLYCFEMCADSIRESSNQIVYMNKTPLGRQFLAKSFYEDERFQIMFVSKP